MRFTNFFTYYAVAMAVLALITMVVPVWSQCPDGEFECHPSMWAAHMRAGARQSAVQVRQLDENLKNGANNPAWYEKWSWSTLESYNIIHPLLFDLETHNEGLSVATQNEEQARREMEAVVGIRKEDALARLRLGEELPSVVLERYLFAVSQEYTMFAKHPSHRSIAQLLDLYSDTVDIVGYVTWQDETNRRLQADKSDFKTYRNEVGTAQATLVAWSQALTAQVGQESWWSRIQHWVGLTSTPSHINFSAGDRSWITGQQMVEDVGKMVRSGVKVGGSRTREELTDLRR